MTSATTRDDASDPAFLGPQTGRTSSISLDVTEAAPTPPPVPTPAPQTLTYPSSTSEPSIQVSLTHAPLSLTEAAQFINSPSAGANVFFTGTTRDTFNSRTVTRLEYSSYPALALRTMLSLCQTVQQAHSLQKVYLVHRLGVVNVSETSIIVALSSAHRKAAWDAGEELLELVKTKVEVWKREWFLDGDVVQGKDGAMGTLVDTAAATTTTPQSNINNSSSVVGSSTVHQAGERGEWRANAEKDSSGNPVLK